MHKYISQPVVISAEIFDVLKGFSCGVPKMDEILQSRTLLAELNTQNPQAYCVYNQEEDLVAFYIVGKISMPIDANGEEHYVEMVDIACLAVAEKYRYKRVGTAILDDICEMADAIVPDGDYIHVEALDLDDGSYSAVRFYEKYGFQYDSRAGSDAARMFYPLVLSREC